MPRSAIRRVARPVARRLSAALTARWAPYTRLFLVGEGAGWVIDEELRAVEGIAERLGVTVADRRLLGGVERQSVFYGSQFTLLGRLWRPTTNRVGTTYFHGRPGTPGAPEFDACYRALCEHHEELQRIQVSHCEMEEIVLASGIDPAKVFRIPIGIDLAYFEERTPETRRAARAALGLPEGAFVVGSFQKDGEGWGAGLEPKAIKGPDVLLDVFRALRARVPELYVLLSGPARGYVQSGLERLGIPYLHRSVGRYSEIGDLYRALDAYVVPARQEGGPKSVLESMATGVPLVATRVGQASDLVRHGENGWLGDVEDAEGLAHWLEHIATGAPELASVIASGRRTAEANSYAAQAPLWCSFFTGFVSAA